MMTNFVCPLFGAGQKGNNGFLVHFPQKEQLASTENDALRAVTVNQKSLVAENHHDELKDIMELHRAEGKRRVR